MTQPLRFDGRVAIVTGAGQGLGRTHALELARRGARVVINDVREAALNAVRRDIEAEGGQAVAVASSVATPAGAGSVIETARSAYDGIDIVVNNAGTSGHGEFQQLTPAEYDRVMDTNLRGTWEVTRAAWPHLRAGKYGRVIMTASGSGLYGEPGAPQYGASKGGTYSLALSLAIEGAAYGIAVNVLCPAAFTPLSDSLLPEGEFKDWFRTMLPESVSQLVAWLAHESCPVSGEVYGALGDVVVRYAMASNAVLLKNFRAEDIAPNLARLRDMQAHAAFFPSLNEHLAAMAGLMSGRSASGAFQLPGTDAVDTDPALRA